MSSSEGRMSSLREQIAEILIKPVHDIPFGFKHYKKKDALVDADRILAEVAKEVEGMPLLTEDSIIARSVDEFEYCQLAVDIGKWVTKAQRDHIVTELRKEGST